MPLYHLTYALLLSNELMALKYNKTPHGNSVTVTQARDHILILRWTLDLMSVMKETSHQVVAKAQIQITFTCTLIRMDIPVRCKRVTKADIILKHELEMADRLELNAYLCPFCCCHGGRRLEISRIKEHLQRHGRDPFLQRSMLGGDPIEGYTSDAHGLKLKAPLNPWIQVKQLRSWTRITRFIGNSWMPFSKVMIC